MPPPVKRGMAIGSTLLVPRSMGCTAHSMCGVQSNSRTITSGSVPTIKCTRGTRGCQRSGGTGTKAARRDVEGPLEDWL
ncbi:hypothetical protein BDZ89DRAFT_337518 [Hymenopellis radicata]|nr:hypothetical protein BDZ89DRAFT_337518 [Hymenopellis radicata]